MRDLLRTTLLACLLLQPTQGSFIIHIHVTSNIIHHVLTIVAAQIALQVLTLGAPVQDKVVKASMDLLKTRHH